MTSILLMIVLIIAISKFTLKMTFEKNTKKREQPQGVSRKENFIKKDRTSIIKLIDNPIYI